MGPLEVYRLFTHKASNDVCCLTTKDYFIPNSSWQFQLRHIPPTRSPPTSGYLPALSGGKAQDLHKKIPPFTAPVLTFVAISKTYQC